MVQRVALTAIQRVKEPGVAATLTTPAKRPVYDKIKAGTLIDFEAGSKELEELELAGALVPVSDKRAQKFGYGLDDQPGRAYVMKTPSAFGVVETDTGKLKPGEYQGDEGDSVLGVEGTNIVQGEEVEAADAAAEATGQEASEVAAESRRGKGRRGRGAEDGI